MDAMLDRLDELAEIPYEQITVDAALAHEEEIVALNRLQLDKGLDSAGKNLGKYKNYKYKNRWEPIDLLGEGPFRDSFKLDAFDGGFQVAAPDEKTPWLEKRFGESIVGVPEDQNDVVGQIILPDMLEAIKRRI